MDVELKRTDAISRFKWRLAGRIQSRDCELVTCNCLISDAFQPRTMTAGFMVLVSQGKSLIYLTASRCAYSSKVSLLQAKLLHETWPTIRPNETIMCHVGIFAVFVIQTYLNHTNIIFLPWKVSWQFNSYLKNDRT